MALLIALVLGIPLGMLGRPAARHARSTRSIMTGSILGFCLPNFWQGMMLIMIFSVWLGWLPSTGRGESARSLGIHDQPRHAGTACRHLILPAVNLSLFKLALVIRLTRAGVRETLPLDFVKFARAKGLSERRIIGVHVLKNILIPIVTVIGLEFGCCIAFAMVTETIFAWPGMGKLLIDSIIRLDRPVVVAYLMVVVMLFIVINLVVDILYSVLDPRVRLGRRSRRDGRCATVRREREAARPAESCTACARAGRPASAASSVLSCCFSRVVGALDLAAGPLRSGAARHVRRQAAAAAPRAWPACTYWLGTDGQGRDMLSAMFYGLRTSLGSASSAALRACGRHRARPGRRLFRRQDRHADHAPRRLHAGLSDHPGGADAARAARPGRRAR